MKLLHVVPTLLSSSLQYGGPSAAMLEMCAEFIGYGISVTVVSIHEEGVDAGVISKRLDDNGKVSAFCFPKYLSKLLPSGFDFSPPLRTWFNQHINEFDLVHIHTIFNYPSTQACIAAMRGNVPYILRPCGMLDAWCLRKSRLKKKIWMSLYGRRALNNSAALHFTSDEEKKSADALCIKAPEVVLPLGIAQNKKKGNIEESIFYRRIKEFGDKKKILFLSRLHPKKGLDLLIPALGRLAERRKDFIFILAGRGEPKHQRQVNRLLKKHCLEEITIKTGFVGGLEKEAALHLSDMFVLPSYQENFGLAVAEAMSCGLAVVISDRVNIHEDISSYNAGIVTSCNTLEVANAIEKLLDDGAMRIKMGENGKSLVRDKYNWDIIIPRLIKLYEQILIRKQNKINI